MQDKKKRKPLVLLPLEQLPELDLLHLVEDSRAYAELQERKLRKVRSKMTERDLPIEKFLSRERGALTRHNKRRLMHVQAEWMPEKDVVVEAPMPLAEPSNNPLQRFLNS